MTASQWQELQAATAAAFAGAPIKRLAQELGTHWYYSICATRITPARPLLIGFNWGASAQGGHEPQREMPTRTFEQLLDQQELGSLARIMPYLKRHLPDVDLSEIGQTNFCFFRSKTEDQITAEDIELSTPLFLKLLEIAQPSRIIGLSARLREYLGGLPGQVEVRAVEHSGRRVLIGKGYVEIDRRPIPVCVLPHPNHRLPTALREKAWQTCFAADQR